MATLHLTSKERLANGVDSAPVVMPVSQAKPGVLYRETPAMAAFFAKEEAGGFNGTGPSDAAECEAFAC